MNDYDDKSFDIMVVGPGKEFFEELYGSEKGEFRNHDLYLRLREGFSSPEITQVLISIGSNVIAGLSVYYISKIFDKVLSARSEAKKQGRDLQINVSVSDKIIIKDVENIQEIERVVDIVVKTKVEKVE